MAIIVVANKKGGVGKTVTAQNLASYLARAGRKVLAIDLDGQRSLSLVFRGDDLDEPPSMADVLTGSATLGDTARIVEEHSTVGGQLSLAPAHRALSVIEFPADALRKALKDAPWDHIVIDTPPSLGPLVLVAYGVADWILTPVQCAPLAVYGLIDQLGDFVRLRASRPALRMAIMPTFVNAKRVACTDALKQLQTLNDRFPDIHILPGIRATTKLEVAPGYRMAIFDYDKHGPAAKDYEDVGGMLLTLIEQEAGGAR